MKIILESHIARESCKSLSAYSDNGKFAEIEIRVDQESPYGVPWIPPGDEVHFWRSQDAAPEEGVELVFDELRQVCATGRLHEANPQ